MMHKRTFALENELSFNIPIDKYTKLLKLHNNGIPLLFPMRFLYIEQNWFNEESLPNGVTKRSRVRMWYDKKNPAEKFYEYTTKYYTDKFRVELNSEIDEPEYLFISSVEQKKFILDKKDRCFVQDTETGIVYMVDIHQTYVTIEIEFDSQEDMKKFKIPQWIKDNRL